ncbi:MAG: ATPase domain-containing protein [Actinomycetota bacterium]
MGKVRRVLSCTACGHQVSQWVGRCPGCGEWGTVEQGALAPARTAASASSLQGSASKERLRTGSAGLDRVLGGGLVPGSVVLLAGEPGIGKSSLLLQIAASLSVEGNPTLIASGEESREQVAGRAERLGLDPSVLSFVSGRELADVVEVAAASRPPALIVDSIQAIRDPEIGSLPGSPAQVRACADALVGLAKSHGIAVVLSGQVTKDGDLAGPRTLEHAVDAVCALDRDPSTGLRVLAGGKNRFGPEGEVAWFEMATDGMREIEPATVVPELGEVGAAVALVSAGRRALAVQVQALSSSTQGPPRRHVAGLDPRRFGVVAAVTDRAAGLGLSHAEIYGAVAGGIRVEEPAADLAVAAALASAVSGVPPPPRSAFCGEISLTGAVRLPPAMGARLAAAAGARLEIVFCPGGTSAPKGVRVVSVDRVEDALGWARVRSEPRSA